MSDKPHTVAIGAFVIGASLIAIATLLFLLGSGFGRKETVVMAFDGSVKGLNVGAPLALRGVKVGEVTDIEVVLDSANANVIMVVEANFDADNIRRKGISDADLAEELIARGLRAQLNIQSLLDYQDWALRGKNLDARVPPEQFWDPSFVQYANGALGAAP